MLNAILVWSLSAWLLDMVMSSPLSLLVRALFGIVILLLLTNVTLGAKKSDKSPAQTALGASPVYS